MPICFWSMHPGFAAPCRTWCPVVREKAGFTHDSGKLGSDVRGKRFSTHGAENLSGEKKNRPGTAPDLLSSGYRGETSCPAFRRYRYKFHSAGH